MSSTFNRVVIIKAMENKLILILSTQNHLWPLQSKAITDFVVIQILISCYHKIRKSTAYNKSTPDYLQNQHMKSKSSTGLKPLPLVLKANLLIFQAINSQVTINRIRTKEMDTTPWNRQVFSNSEKPHHTEIRAHTPPSCNHLCYTGEENVIDYVFCFTKR